MNELEEKLEALWNAYQIGQVSCDHTAREVFYEVVKPLIERITELEPAAECWIALSKCYRITCMGSAGLIEKMTETGYAHATFNLWTVRPGSEPKGWLAEGSSGDAQDLHGRGCLADFMMIAIKNHPLENRS